MQTLEIFEYDVMCLVFSAFSASFGLVPTDVLMARAVLDCRTSPTQHVRKLAEANENDGGQQELI